MTAEGATYVLALVVAGDAVRTLGTLLYIKRQPNIQGSCQLYHMSIKVYA